MEKLNKKKRVGIVVSDKMLKTRVVRVGRVTLHPVYEKILRTNKKYKVHDEGNQSQVGDLVEIAETRPLSKEKCWALSRVLKKQKNILGVATEEVKV